MSTDSRMPESAGVQPGPVETLRVRLSRKCRLVLVYLAISAVLLLLAGDVIPRWRLQHMSQLPVGISRHVTMEPTKTTVLALSAHALDDVPTWAKDQPGCDKGYLSPLHCWSDPGVLHIAYDAVTVEAEESDEVDINALIRVKHGDTAVAELTDQVRLEKSSRMPVAEPDASLMISIPRASSGMLMSNSTRDGVQYFFPSVTEKKSYEYYDRLAMTSEPLDFVEETTTDSGMTVYRFAQTLEPRRVVYEGQPDHRVSNINFSTMELPAAQLFDAPERTRRGLKPDEIVEVNTYYTATRELLVEPQSGEIVDSHEIMHLYLAADDEDAHGDALKSHSSRSAFSANLNWDAETRATQEAYAQDVISTKRNLALLSWVCKFLLLVVVARAVVEILRNRRGSL